VQIGRLDAVRARNRMDIIADVLAFSFYNGSLQNAEKFAVEHNFEVSDWMLDYFQNNYRGPKP